MGSYLTYYEWLEQLHDEVYSALYKQLEAESEGVEIGAD